MVLFRKIRRIGGGGGGFFLQKALEAEALRFGGDGVVLKAGYTAQKMLGGRTGREIGCILPHQG